MNGDGVIESRYFDNGFLDNWDLYVNGSHGIDGGDNLGFDRDYRVGSDGVCSNFRDLLAEDLNSEVSGVDNRCGTISSGSLDVELVFSALGSAVGGDLNLSVAFSHPFDIGTGRLEGSLGSLSPLAVLDLSKFRKSEGFSGVEFKYGVLESSSVLDISSLSLGREYVHGSGSSCYCGSCSFGNGRKGSIDDRSIEGKVKR